MKAAKMVRRLARLAGVVGVLWTVLAVGAVTFALAQRSRPHPDLRVTGGSAKVVTTTVRRVKLTTLTGSFTVTDVGARAAPRSAAWIDFVHGRQVKRIHDYLVPALRVHGKTKFTVSVRIGANALARVDWEIRACAVIGRNPKAKAAADGCARLGVDNLAPKAGGAATGTTTTPVTTTSPTPSTTPAPTASTPSTTATTPSTTTTTPTAPVSQVPTDPATGYTVDQPFFEADGLGQDGQYDGVANTSPEDEAYDGGFFTSGYWVDVPNSYDESNQTPETLLVWMHGCQGVAYSDAVRLTSEYTSDRSYIVISLNGPEAGQGAGPECWDTSDQTDVTKVLTDIYQVEAEFNINRSRVIIGGYSSGGDLAYQTIFLHADTFAGILAINTNPVRDNTFGPNGISQAIAGAAYPFPIVQISHASDDVYHVAACGYGGEPTCPSGDSAGDTDPDVGVTPQISALETAHFPVTYTILAGHHYDDEAPANCWNPPALATCTSGTYYDIAHSLLSTIATDGWESPAP